MRVLLLIFALFVSPFATQPVFAQEKPRNVLLIVADDLGRDLGCYGNTAIKTPNLDKLARNGVRFANAYSSVASCSPSRASLYTGLFTHQNGQYGLQHSPHLQQSRSTLQALPNLLRAVGYYTGIIGKFHTGPQSSYNFHAEITKGTGGSRDVAAMAKLAQSFISERGKRPFFLVVGFADPHRAGKGFGNDKFAQDPAEVKYDPATVKVPYHLPDQPEVRQELAEYYQSVSRMDRGVGHLLDMLEKTGQLDNTLIIFVSDNGIPFPGAKTTLYASGTHLPLIISCREPAAPVRVPSGRTNNALVSYADVAPTILDWAKAKGPEYKLPGRSLLPILEQDDPKGWDEVFGSHQFHEITMYYPMRSITTRQHKYIVNLANGLEYPLASDLWGSATWQGIRKRGDKMMGQRSVEAFLRRPKEELYDLTKDPNELTNLAADPVQAQTLTRLRERVRAWQVETGDPWTILYRNEKASFNR